MKNQNPLFSIIIPTHNRSVLLMTAIQSVINQLFDDWELIIVDDGSEDETSEKVNELKDSRIHYHYQEHSERSAARNLGIAKAQGRYVCFLDDDDEYLPNHLEVFHQYLQKENFPKLILRSGFIRKEGNEEQKTTNYNSSKHKNPVRFAANNMCGVGSLCIPTQFLVEDQFPPDFPHWQDTHLFLRLLSKYSFHQLEAFTYLYKIHPDMGSRKVESEEQLQFRAEINVKAIDDLFIHYDFLVSKFLLKNTSKFLKAEKWIEYAVVARGSGYNLLAKELIKKSLHSGLHFKFWKYYLMAILVGTKRN